MSSRVTKLQNRRAISGALLALFLTTLACVELDFLEPRDDSYVRFWECIESAQGDGLDEYEQVDVQGCARVVEPAARAAVEACIAADKERAALDACLQQVDFEGLRREEEANATVAALEAEATASAPPAPAALVLSNIAYELQGCFVNEEATSHNGPHVTCNYLVTLWLNYSTPTTPIIVQCGDQASILLGKPADHVYFRAFEQVVSAEPMGAVVLQLDYLLNNRTVPFENYDANIMTIDEPPLACALRTEEMLTAQYPAELAGLVGYSQRDQDLGRVPADGTGFPIPPLQIWPLP